MSFFSDFSQKQDQSSTLEKNTIFTVLAPYLQRMPLEVSLDQKQKFSEPLKGTLFVPPLLEPAFSPSRAAHWILRQGNFEEFSTLKKMQPFLSSLPQRKRPFSAENTL